MLIIEITQPLKAHLCCLYIPPSRPESYMLEVLHIFNSLPRNTFLLINGDLNCPDIDWDTLSGSSHLNSALCDTLFELGLTQIIREPTHTHGNILDLLVTNQPEQISELLIDKHTCSSTSDHHLITYTIKLKPQNVKKYKTLPQSILLHSKADFASISNYIDRQNLTNQIRHQPITDAWNTFLSTLTTACDLYTPSIRPTTCKSPKWFTPDIKHQINQIRSLRRRIKKNPVPSRLSKLTRMETKLNHTIHSAKLSYETNLACSNSPQSKKLLYNYLNDLSKHNTTPQTIFHNDIPTSCPSSKAEVFNNYFNSVFTRSNYTLPGMEDLPSPPSNQISSISTNQTEVCTILLNLNANKAMGNDGISPHTLKHCAYSLAPALTILFNKCFEHSTIPTEWKIQRIQPIFKSGSKSIVSNYRPISILSVISKTFEQIVHKKIIEFIESIITPAQFGFLRNRSCLTQLLTSYAKTVQSIEDKRTCDTIYLDFSKAFDCIPHNELLLKLWTIGITGPLWLLIHNYLQNRLHFVSIDGAKSSLLPVISGVPQGGVLGPLLFLIYINDLPSVVNHSSIYLFADDSKLLQSITSQESTSDLQSDIDAVITWCKKWKLSLNPHKCSHINFNLSISHKHPQLSM